MQHYGVAVDITDEDGDTPLFAAESVAVATCLVEELNADVGHRNDEGQTAEEKIEAEDEFVLVAHYLRGRAEPTADEAAGTDALRADTNGSPASSRSNVPDPSVTAPTAGVTSELRTPPPLPNQDIKINMGVMEELPPGTEPDPEVRRRIEELAARDDFQSEEGQAALRKLVEEVVGGLREGAGAEGRDVRRRVE